MWIMNERLREKPRIRIAFVIKYRIYMGKTAGIKKWAYGRLVSLD